jgi:hypothetical protein
MSATGWRRASMALGMLLAVAAGWNLADHRAVA